MQNMTRSLRRLPFWIPVFAFCCAWLSVGALPAHAASQVLTLNNTNATPYSTPAHDGYADLIALEAFRRVGVELRLVELPPERGLLNANAGIQDGDLSRIAGIDEKYPNLIRVPEKFIDWEFTAFAKNPKLESDWASIRNRPVAHIKGWKIYEQQLAGANLVTPVENVEQLFRLLAADRVDVALYERWQGLALMRSLNLHGISPRPSALATREMFIYLNKRHAALVPQLAAALRALKKEGFYQKAYRQALQPYVKAQGQ